MKYEAVSLELNAAMDTACAMATAARTAPKARGMDELIVTVLDGDDLERIADEMRRIGDERGVAFFSRDAKNIRESRMIVLVGVRNKPRGVPVCGNCGFENCAENAKAGGVCALCVVDLGIAIGSAVSVATDRRVDTRVMFSAGKAAIALGYLDGAHTAYGLPLSVSGKNPYFDRQ